MISKKYTAQYKILMVEEYLRQKQEQPKLSIAQFASDNEISDSTFNDWVVKYKRQGNGFCNIVNYKDVPTSFLVGYTILFITI